MFLNTDSGGVDFFKVKLTFGMLMCTGNSIHFRHTNGCYCESVKVFDIKMTRPLLSHVFWNTGSSGVDIFWSKANILNVNCARQQHSFPTHEREFLWQCKSFWNRTCLDPRVTWTPSLRIHAECSNLLSCRDQTFTVVRLMKPTAVGFIRYGRRRSDRIRTTRFVW